MVDAIVRQFPVLADEVRRNVGSLEGSGLGLIAVVLAAIAPGIAVVWALARHGAVVDGRIPDESWARWAY